MLRFLFLVPLLGPVFAAAEIPLAEYRARRENFRQANADTVLVIAATAGAADEIRTGYIQESNFLYLTGWREPGAVMLAGPGTDVLFLPHHDERRERYTGRQWSAEDPGVREHTGFDTVLPIEKLESELSRALASAPRVMTLAATPFGARLKAALALRTVEDAAAALSALRNRKSPAEIELIRHSIGVSIEAQRAAWTKIAPGNSEYQAAAAFVGTLMDRGCQRVAYTPIAASGPNGAVLHYSANSRKLDAGDLIVLDAGAECNSYASDLTRTLPVNGKFTARQRELYEIVLGAQRAAIAAVKPGMTLARDGPDSLTRIAREFMNARGADRHGKPLGSFFTHGIGHPVGLDVQDRFDPARPLEAGMVITIEPGLYLPDEGIGIRIEDMVLVTAAGGQVLSDALPRNPGDIERAMASQ